MLFFQVNDIWRKYIGVDDGFYILFIVSYLQLYFVQYGKLFVFYIVGQGSYILYICIYVGNYFEYMYIYFGESMLLKDKIVLS